MKKRYKLIINLGLESETITYFDRLVKSKLQKILDKQNKNYLLLHYDDFLKAYLPTLDKLSDNEKEFYHNNLHYYCEKAYY